MGTAHDPYHQCLDRWNPCCEQNAAAAERSEAYAAYFGAAAGGRAPVRKYCTLYGKVFTQKRWLWYEVVFFEDLPPPDRMPPTACGVCPLCVRHRGLADRPCLFPQRAYAYARWHAAARRRLSAPSSVND